MLTKYCSVLTRPEHLQQIFKDSDKHTKATNNNSGWLMSQVLGQCVGLVSGEVWRKIRAITEVPFQHKAVKDYVPSVQRCVQQYVQDLREHARLSHGILDPAGDMKMLPFFVVAEIIYGELNPAMVADLRRLAPNRERLFKYVIGGGLARYSWSQFLPTAANHALREFRQAWRAFNQRALERARLVHPQPPIVDMYAAVDDGEITEEQLLQTVDESLYANLDVTTGALSWNLVWLASSPETRQRLREELQTFKQQDKVDQYLLSNQTFLNACILESSRLKPLAAFSVPQAAPSERTLDDWIIPAKTNFVVDSYALNIRNEYWGADRTKYRPDRFFDLKTKDLRYHFWRFGFGPRQCMGKYVADLMIRCLLVHLLENYELGLPDDRAEWKRDPESWITHPQLDLKCTSLASPDKGM
jgi:cytochrome P450